MGEYRSKYRDDYEHNQPSSANEHQTELSTLEPMETYKMFMMHQDESTAPEVCLQRYEEYKKKYETRLKRAFFQDHKKQHWLQSRYSPAISTQAEKRRFKRMAKEAKAFYSRVADSSIQFCFDEQLPPDSSNDNTTTEEPKDESRDVPNNDMLPPRQILYIRRVPASCPVPALEEVISTTGGDYEALFLSDPAKKADCDFDRSAWVLYGSVEAAEDAMPKLQNAFLHDPDMTHPIRLQVSIFRARANLKTPSSASLPDRITHDLAQATELAKLLDQSSFCQGEQKEDAKSVADILNFGKEKCLSEKQMLDTLIGYLRRVHSFVYYAGQQCIDMGDILHTHPAIFCRPPVTEHDAEERDDGAKWGSWASQLDSKLEAVKKSLDPEAVQSRVEETKRLVEEVEALEEKALADVYDAYVTTVDGDKQRCNLCKKLFKSQLYVKKHLKNKHPELVLDKAAEAAEGVMWDQYNNDPNAPIPNIITCSKPTLGGGRRSGRGGGRSFNNSGHGRGGNYYRNDGGGGGYRSNYRGSNNYRSGGGRGGYRHRSDSYSRPSSGGGNPPRSNSPPSSREKDPRAVSTSYHDLDNLKDKEVDLDFNVLGSLPPPKKKQKKTA